MMNSEFSTMPQRSDSECHTVRREILQLRDRGRNLGLSDVEIYELFESAGKSKSRSLHQSGVKRGYGLRIKQKLLSVESLTVVMVVFLACRAYRATQGESLSELIYGTKCVYTVSHVVSEIVKPLSPCDYCENLSHVPTYDGEVPAQEFQELYSDSRVPVIMRGATKNWSALTTFSYQYLKSLYLGRDYNLIDEIENCQFLRYSDLSSIAATFNISNERAAFKDGERWWYAGWIVCDPYVDVQLRRHFHVPECVQALDPEWHKLWLFMGPPGKAASTHLDNVIFPSWQAQITGKKTWILTPSPECESVCKTFSVTVEPGDLLFINTNVWFHATYVLPGDISITLASEFDPMAMANGLQE